MSAVAGGIKNIGALYLERAVATLDRTGADVYGCLLTSLENDVFSSRWWPNKPIESMFSGKSDDNQLPHSSVLMRTDICRRAGNYNEHAIGLGADDYQLWYRLHKSGAKFVRDDAVRNVVYRIHEQNSLKIRKARYGVPPSAAGSSKAGRLITGAAAASIAFLAAPALGAEKSPIVERTQAGPQEKKEPDGKSTLLEKTGLAAESSKLIPPHS